MLKALAAVVDASPNVNKGEARYTKVLHTIDLTLATARKIAEFSYSRSMLPLTEYMLQQAVEGAATPSGLHLTAS